MQVQLKSIIGHLPEGFMDVTIWDIKDGKSLLAKTENPRPKYQFHHNLSSHLHSTCSAKRMSSLKTITLHGHRECFELTMRKSHLLTCHIAGPNPWKVAILLEELGLPYSTKIRTTAELKKPEFLAINRNGMAPVIEDPNTNLLLAEVSLFFSLSFMPFPFLLFEKSFLQVWLRRARLTLNGQSGAIMDYILEQYDTDKRISFPTLQDSYLMKQWLESQTTTQGPTLQSIVHSSPTFGENNPTARARYLKDFLRVLKVLDDELSERGGWLVGGKCSAADLSYVPFHSRLDFIMAADKPNMAVEYPNVDAWYKRMLERGAVKKVVADHQAALKGVVFPGDRQA